MATIYYQRYLKLKEAFEKAHGTPNAQTPFMVDGDLFLNDVTPGTVVEIPAYTHIKGLLVPRGAEIKDQTLPEGCRIETNGGETDLRNGNITKIGNDVFFGGPVFLPENAYKLPETVTASYFTVGTTSLRQYRSVKEVNKKLRPLPKTEIAPAPQ